MANKKEPFEGNGKGRLTVDVPDDGHHAALPLGKGFGKGGRDHFLLPTSIAPSARVPGGQFHGGKFKLGGGSGL